MTLISDDYLTAQLYDLKYSSDNIPLTIIWQGSIKI